jgi:uncharacterized protein YqjF (DUF2071 family)
MQAWQKGRSWAIPIQLSTAWLSLAGCHLPRSARADGIVVTCKEAPQRDLGQESADGCRLAFQAPRVPDRAAAGPMMRVVAGDDMSAGGPDDLTATCPFTVERPVMRQRWERLTFLHWSFEPADVQRLLPAGLAVDTFDGRAWVGLVPFFMHVASAGGQQAPWASRFCETNVRTYVRDAAGRPGIWFFSLDAARLGAVAVARATYGLPYYWSAMRLAEDGEQITYTCRRRIPGPRTAVSKVRISIGNQFGPAELDQRDHFLTARWILFSISGRGHRLARACHQPWPLRRARAEIVEDRLIAAAGLPQPQDAPLVHYSPGVDVAIGRPENGLS